MLVTVQPEESVVDVQAIRHDETITHDVHGVSVRSPIAGHEIGCDFQDGIGGG